MAQTTCLYDQRGRGSVPTASPTRCPGWAWVSIDVHRCTLAKGHEGPHSVEATCGCWWNSLDGIHGEIVRCRYHEGEDLRIALANERAR